VLLEQPHRFGIDRFAADADGRRRAKEIKEALAPSAAPAGLDE
jgi:hypothetical protein